MSGIGKNAAEGFVLAVTLWLLAAMAVAASIVMLWTREEVRGATEARERLDDEIAMIDTRETLLYLAATRDVTVAGLPPRALNRDEETMRRLDEFGSLRKDARGGEIRLDGHAYKGVGYTRFALQDEAGLVPLVRPSPSLLDRLLAFGGVNAERIPLLRDALLDYIDADTLKRLNGAEAREYREAGRPPPPNRRLLVPQELGAVLGWSDAAEGGLALEEWVTTFYSGAVNLNTAPRDLLPLWVAGCPEKCDLIVARRSRQPFRSSAEIQLLAAVRLPGDPDIDYRYLSDDTIRMTFWGRSGDAWRMHVRLTPLADQAAPWTVLAAYPVPRPAEHGPAQPTGSDLLADTPTAVH